jgi:hypothetical protein
MILLSVILGSGTGAIPESVRTLGTTVVLYVTPDQILPLTSALGALIGLLLMFWHRAIAVVRKVWQLLFNR